MKDLYIYKYNTSGVLTELKPVASLQEQQSYKVENEQGEMVFPGGVTDVAPHDGMKLYLGISPVYDEINELWNSDENAVNMHVESIKSHTTVSDKERIEVLEQALMEVILNG